MQSVEYKIFKAWFASDIYFQKIYFTFSKELQFYEIFNTFPVIIRFIIRLYHRYLELNERLNITFTNV